MGRAWGLARAAWGLRHARKFSAASPGPCIVHERGADILHDPWFNKGTTGWASRGCGIYHLERSLPGAAAAILYRRQMTTGGHIEKSVQENSDFSPSMTFPERIKVKRLDKTARHIMNILDKEAVDKVKTERDIPDIQAGCIVELKVEAPENKGRIFTVRGLVISRKNAGISTTIQVRRLEANVGVDTIFPLYSPNIKAMKVLEKRSVRRAKLYYVRDRPFNIAMKELAQRTAKKRETALRNRRTEQSKKQVS